MAKLGNAWGFQQRKVAALKKRPFDKLAALPESQALTVPARLKGLDIFIRRKALKHGGIEITVRVENGPAASTDGFQMLASGKVIPLHDHPVDEKPRSLKGQVLQYLHLEFGESPRDPDALKLSDLSYEGEYVVEGVRKRFWSFPGARGRRYATVAFRGKGYSIGATNEVPPKRPRRRRRT
jgi:hypothetical protein